MPELQETRLPLLRTILRFLTFRASEQELGSLDRRFLIAGLVGTWLVGMGRYWDSPEAHLGQKLGLGSLAYVFALAMLLYVVGLPLRPANWSYRNVLVFLTLTSFPAALYALPVERWVSVESAIQINVWFLGVVAIYRVALYFFYMSRSAGLGFLASLTAVFLPITLMISVITISGYSGAVFDIMGGLVSREPDARDGVNNVLTFLIAISCLSLPVWLLLYGVMIAAAQKRARTN